MTDISKLDDKIISELAGAYLHATMVFGPEPLEASPRKQRKIRKWLAKLYGQTIWSLPEDLRPFSPTYSDREVLTFLKACHDRAQALAKEREDRILSILAPLDGDTQDALQWLLQFEYWSGSQSEGQDLRFTLDRTPAFQRTLVLKGVEAAPQGKEGYGCAPLTLRKEGDRFCICGDLMGFEEEDPEPFAMTFARAWTEVRVYDASRHPDAVKTPWDLLGWVCYAIARKAALPGDYCNEDEKALLPLIRELASLDLWPGDPDRPCLSFPVLKGLASEHSLKDLVALLSKLETIRPSDGSFYTTARKMTSRFCKQRYAPLWRELWDRVCRSQAGYPPFPEPPSLNQYRTRIQTLMEHHGYTGTYPDFEKTAPLRGIRLENSYDMTYFVGMAKRVRYQIRCMESHHDDPGLTIQFLCGTAFLKKGEASPDLYDCMFDAKGKRLYHTVFHEVAEDGSEETDLETSVRIAVKKTECLKLDKAERKAYYGNATSAWEMFWWIFLLAGGLFGIAMTLIMMLFCILVTVLFGMASQIPEMLMEMPWGLLLAIGWIGFGGAMGLTTVLALRK